MDQVWSRVSEVVAERDEARQKCEVLQQALDVLRRGESTLFIEIAQDQSIYRR